MHTALLLAAVLLVLLGGYLALGLLRRLQDMHRRRALQAAVLGAPLASLGLGLAGLYHFAGRACFLGAPRWDRALAVALLLAMVAGVPAGAGLGLIRLGLLGRALALRGIPAGAELQSVVDRLADRLGAARPRLLLCPYDRPLALVCGTRRPSVLLSTWTVERLERHELEAVLAHELAHIARHDYLIGWLATVLRDAFCYLPTSWAAYRQLQHEKELACDDLAARLAGSLPLASALTKVWQPSLVGPRPSPAQPLVGADATLERRVERLLTSAAGQLPAAPRPRRAITWGAGSLGLAAILAYGAVNLGLMFALLGCGPAGVIARLF